MKDDLFKALGDPTRRKILKMLNAGDLSAGEIGREFGISGASMSHHFNVLRHADLVKVRRNGQQLIYSLNTTVFQDLLATLMDLLPTNARDEVEQPGDKA